MIKKLSEGITDWVTILKKINELVDAANELTKLTEDLSLEAEQLEMNFDNHTHEIRSDFTNKPLICGYPLITQVDERESHHG